MVLNTDMEPIMCLPSLVELSAAALSALPVPHEPLVVVALWHEAGHPDARL